MSSLALFLEKWDVRFIKIVLQPVALIHLNVELNMSAIALN